MVNWTLDYGAFWTNIKKIRKPRTSAGLKESRDAVNLFDVLKRK